MYPEFPVPTKFCVSWGQQLYLPSEGSPAADFYRPQKAILLGQV
jgi:hypothetical protein